MGAIVDLKVTPLSPAPLLQRLAEGKCRGLALPELARSLITMATSGFSLRFIDAPAIKMNFMLTFAINFASCNCQLQLMNSARRK